MYTAFLTNICNGSMYKLLFVDQNPWSHEDYVICCDYATLKQALRQKQVEFVNVKLVDDEVWSATVRDTQVDLGKLSVPLQSPWTVFDFVEGMLYDDAILCNGELPFSCIDIDFATKTLSSNGCVLWSAGSLKSNPAQDLRVCCSTDAFYAMVKPNYVDIWDIRVDGDKVAFSINLDILPCTWGDDYCLLRYNVEELSYLVDRYLHVKSAVRGAQVGNWFKSFLKSDIVRDPDLVLPNNEGLIWDLQVNLPNLPQIVRLLRKYGSWLMSNGRFEPDIFCEKLGITDNSYAKAFGECFCKTVLDQCCYLDRQLRRLEIQLLRYQVAMELAPIDIPNKIPLCDGYLRIERNV